MPSRITVFSNQGVAIAELTTATTRSWLLDDIGRVQFKLATFTDPNCSKAILQYGNFVLIEHLPTRDYAGNINGVLPQWLGVILLPQEWEYGLVTVTAYSIETILAYRPMPIAVVNGSGGAIFSTILQYANQFGGIPIIPGSIYTDQSNLTVPIQLTAYEEIKTLSTNLNQDWDVTWSVGLDRRLTLYGNWYSQKGILTNNVFSEGIGGNMKYPKLTEQGNIINKAVGYIAASSAGTRLQSTQNDVASQSDYGIWGGSQIYNIVSQGGLDLATLSSLQASSRPVITLELTVLDASKSFSFLSVGNIWSVYLYSVGFYGGRIGFQGSARIVGMEYDDMTNEVSLATEVIKYGLTEQGYA